MMFDDEQDIIEFMQSHINNDSEILLLNGNSYEKKILKYLRDRDSLTPNNAHNDLPPDYISTKNNLMFDVMRVNDTEVRKKYDPVKIRESNTEKELRNLFVGLDPNAKIFCCNSGSGYVDEHFYKNYIKHVKRVVTKHIQKIPIWEKEHPLIKNKGLLIFDETECYFEGNLEYMHAGAFQLSFNGNSNIILHEPWNDKDFIEQAYNSDLDFIIWICPYKPHSRAQSYANKWFPTLTFIDIRYPRSKDYIEYDKDNLISI